MRGGRRRSETAEVEVEKCHLICTIFTIYDEISLVKICVGAYRMALNVKLSKKKYSPTEHSALKWTD